MSYIDAFNNQCLNFVKELSEIYPDSDNLIPVKNKLLIVIKTSPNFLIKNFYKTCYQYKTEAYNKNENFFLNYKLSGTVIHSLQLKDLWKNSTETTKEKCWLYIQVLFKLCEKHYTRSINGSL
tara:strand:- start:279 stop:647 length:369 start_codon:yes stop_codon:yes gene_type:complete